MKTLEELLDEEIKAYHVRRMHKHNYSIKDTRYTFERKTRTWFMLDFEASIQQLPLHKKADLLNFVKNEVY